MRRLTSSALPMTTESRIQATLCLFELPLHPYPVHLELSLPVDDEPTVDSELLNGEEGTTALSSR